MMDKLDILSWRTSLKKYVKEYNLPVIKRAAIFKEHLYDCFCE